MERDKIGMDASNTHEVDNNFQIYTLIIKRDI